MLACRLHFNALGDLRHITFRDIVSGPAPLLIVTGFLVAAFCTPVATEVVGASREQLERLPQRHPKRESEAGIELVARETGRADKFYHV